MYFRLCKNKKTMLGRRAMSSFSRLSGGGGGPNYEYLIPALFVGFYMVYSEQPPAFGLDNR